MCSVQKRYNSIALSVGNATGQTDVANMWKCHYSRLLNSASGKSCDKIFVDNFLTRRSSFCNITNFQRIAPMMCNLIKKLPLQKFAGADGITAEHLQYAHYCVCIYLRVLFNLCVSHGFIPEDRFITDIVPILKCKNKDATNVGNYRSIAVATTISKLFEHFILFHIKPFSQLVITNSGLSMVQALICVSSCSSKSFCLTFNRLVLFFQYFQMPLKHLTKYLMNSCLKSCYCMMFRCVLYDCCDIGIVNSKCE